jgi:antitoxin component of MazEF toxin-antitoxin module
VRIGNSIARSIAVKIDNRIELRGWTVLIARNDRTDLTDLIDQTDRTIPDKTSPHFHEGSLRNSGVARDKREERDWRDV